MFSLSLDTPRVRKEKKIDKILKAKTKWKHECPRSLEDLSNALPLTSAAESEGDALLLSSAHSSRGSVYENGAFEMPLPIFTDRVGKREWDLGTDSLEELIHLQSRHWGRPSHLIPGMWEHQEFPTKHITLK